MARTSSIPVIASDGERRFAELIDAFASDPRLAECAASFSDPDPSEKGRKFGSSAMKVGGKIFAMLVKDRLVVKLPRKRVDELIASHKGTRFDPGHGRIMKEWISVLDDEVSWVEFAKEAHDFVRKASK